MSQPLGKLSENYPDLLAWVGKDELGSGKIGIKQGAVAAGLIPMVAVEEHRDRMDMVAPQMRRQARRWGVTIRLVRYVAVEEVVTLTPEEAA